MLSEAKLKVIAGLEKSVMVVDPLIWVSSKVNVIFCKSTAVSVTSKLKVAAALLKVFASCRAGTLMSS